MAPPSIDHPTTAPSVLVATELCCPFCAWGSAASASSYLEARDRVVDQLLRHVTGAHPRSYLGRGSGPAA